MASAERLQQTDELPVEETTASQLTTAAFRALSVQGVTFAYDNDRPVLDDVSLTVERGTCTAIVGTSGIGKSTLLKLILAIYPCKAGRIVLEGENTATADASTRSLMAYVPQGNSLIAGTIRDNITFFRTVEEDRLTEVIRLVCLDEFVASLPQGVDTCIGENGVGVSEGQAQRIAIARALLHDAPILLLDECTSALDAVTEQMLLQNLRTLTDKAVLLISHKDSTVAGSTSVLRLADGKLTPVSE
jgi:ABC-type multidrug transport system fused ATPase/permease subunit